MKKYAIIVAAGSGSRMNSKIPKQFMSLHGKPLFIYALNVFLESDNDLQVILLIPENIKVDIHSLLKFAFDVNRIKAVIGGNSRFESVSNGLIHVPDDSVVFIHDAVRPFITASFIDYLYKTTLAHGCAIPVIDMSDSIRYVDSHKNFMVDRNLYKAVQTPQVFVSEKIKEAYKVAPHSNFTDDASVFESNNNSIFLCEGLKENIKITYPEDFNWAEYKLST